MEGCSPEPRGAGRGRKDPPPEPLEGAWPCDTWIRGLLASRSGRGQISVV